GLRNKLPSVTPIQREVQCPVFPGNRIHHAHNKFRVEVANLVTGGNCIFGYPLRSILTDLQQRKTMVYRRRIFNDTYLRTIDVADIFAHERVSPTFGVFPISKIWHLVRQLHYPRPVTGEIDMDIPSEMVIPYR